MGLIAPFKYTDWVQLFPMFQTVSEAQINFALPLAYGYWPNDGSSPATTMEIQTSLLYLMVAHIAQLMYGINGQPPSGMVGRISSAGEGSVNVATEWPTNPDNAWFLQTQFGAMFWQATLPYRLMHYVPGRTRRVNNPWPWPGRWGG